MDEKEIYEVFDTVAEMSSDGVGGLVPLSSDVVQAVKDDDDDDPRFATFVIESGWSKSRRYWGPELFGEIVSEISSSAGSEPIVGYMGHIKPEDDSYSFLKFSFSGLGQSCFRRVTRRNWQSRHTYCPERKLATI